MIPSVWALLLAQAAAATTAITDAPLEPKAQWVANFDANRCVLAREFGSGDQAVLLALDSVPNTRAIKFSIMRQDDGRIVGKAPITLTVLPSGKSAFAARATAKVASSPYNRADQVSLLTKDLGDLAEAQMFRFDLGDRTVTLRLSGMDKAVATLNECLDDLVKSWGVDPAVQRALTKQAEPANDPVQWITNLDYPLVAVRAGYDGTVDSWWTVDATGKVIGCRITDGPHLDVFGPLLCGLATSRARFRPALDANGKPVASLFGYRFTFNLPR